MQSYNARYSSFAPPQRSKSSFKASSSLKWPHPTSFLATPTSLATAGFYFNPSSATPDAVSCFLCEKGLADWDPEDDPAEIHAQKCPKCPWAILKCITDLSDNGSVNFSSPSRLPSSRTMEKARLATFGSEGKKWWPHDAKNKGPTSKVMAKAGFIFTPAGSKDDTCSCIYCGIELGGWQSDDDPLYVLLKQITCRLHFTRFSGRNTVAVKPKRDLAFSSPTLTIPRPFRNVLVPNPNLLPLPPLLPHLPTKNTNRPAPNLQHVPLVANNPVAAPNQSPPPNPPRRRPRPKQSRRKLSQSIMLH
ncbi:inhibitor of apoptosis repeat-containing protein [Ramaria rubella]|nr:inhibitor of apoptosis repeat-containing protein [Ramaria rubella]